MFIYLPELTKSSIINMKSSITNTRNDFKKKLKAKIKNIFVRRPVDNPSEDDIPPKDD